MILGNRWPLLAILGVGAGLILALFYLDHQVSGQPQPAHGGRYVEAVVGSPERINPLYAGLNEADRSLSSLVFSGLTRMSENGVVLPDLAERWTISADHRTYVFHLRQNVVWHDGIPFTADDVIFTWTTIQHAEFNGDPTLVQLWNEITFEKVDTYTVAVHLPQPYAPFLAYANVGILPKHLLFHIEVPRLADSAFNQNPIGTGPFRLRELTAESAILDANPSYHFGTPFLAEIELRFYEDVESALRAVEQGKADGLLLRPPSTAKRPGEATKTSQALYSRALPSTLLTLVYLNTDTPVLQDQRVRQALLAALNREQVIANVIAEPIAMADSLFAPETWAAISSKRPTYDLQKAQALLDEAGWQPGEDMIRQKNGQQLRFTLVTNDQPTRVALARAIADQWRQVGVVADVSVVDSTTLVREMLLPRRYQAALFAWDTGYDPDPYPAWHSSQQGNGGRNLAQYENALADDLLARARQILNPEERRRLYSEFQRIFWEEVPSIPLYYPRYVYWLSNEVQGVQTGVLFDAGTRFANVHQWYVETRHVRKIDNR